MGSGHAGCSAEVLKDEVLQLLLPDEYAVLMAAVTMTEAYAEAVEVDGGVDNVSALEVLSRHTQWEPMELLDNDEDKQAAVVRSYRSLQEAFAKKFSREADSELQLDLSFHDRDECGDRYDEVDGPFWCVGGRWTRTESAIALDEAIIDVTKGTPHSLDGGIHNVHFVTYG